MPAMNPNYCRALLQAEMPVTDYTCQLLGISLPFVIPQSVKMNTCIQPVYSTVKTKRLLLL